MKFFKIILKNIYVTKERNRSLVFRQNLLLPISLTKEQKKPGKPMLQEPWYGLDKEKILNV